MLRVEKKLISFAAAAAAAAAALIHSESKFCMIFNKNKRVVGKRTKINYFVHGIGEGELLRQTTAITKALDKETRCINKPCCHGTRVWRDDDH